jgi:hypothetical protein
MASVSVRVVVIVCVEIYEAVRTTASFSWSNIDIYSARDEGAVG